MKILMLCFRFPRGIDEPIVSGEVKNPFNIAVELVNQGHAVSVISVDDRTGINEFSVFGISVYVVRDIRIKGFIRYLVRSIRTRSVINRLKDSYPDIVHSHVSFAGLGFLLSDLKHIDLISTPHGTNIPEISTELGRNPLDWIRHINAYIQYTFDKFVYSRSSALISVSEFQVKEMLEIYQLDKKKINVIYNGASRIYSDSRDENREYLLFVGRAAKKKGITHILELAKKYPKENFTCVLGIKRFVTVPDHLVTQLENQENITVLQSIHERDMPLIYRKAKLLIVPSEGYESLPTVILEAVRSGTRTIATNLWGIPEIIKDKRLLFSENNFQELCDSLEHALNTGIDVHTVYLGKHIETEVSKLVGIYRKCTHG